jgi:sec-independent protein translocase protein TatB
MLSLPHLVIIFLIVLMVFGPEKLPELARMLGKATAEFRRMTGDVRRVMDDEMREIERQAEAKKREAAATAQIEAQAQPAALPAADSTTPEGTVPYETPSIGRPTSGKAEELNMDPAPDSEIEQNYSHVKHNPS